MSGDLRHPRDVAATAPGPTHLTSATRWLPLAWLSRSRLQRAQGPVSSIVSSPQEDQRSHDSHIAREKLTQILGIPRNFKKSVIKYISDIIK